MYVAPLVRHNNNCLAPQPQCPTNCPRDSAARPEDLTAARFAAVVYLPILLWPPDLSQTNSLQRETKSDQPHTTTRSPKDLHCTEAIHCHHECPWSTHECTLVLPMPALSWQQPPYFTAAAPTPTSATGLAPRAGPETREHEPITTQTNKKDPSSHVRQGGARGSLKVGDDWCMQASASTASSSSQQHQKDTLSNTINIPSPSLPTCSPPPCHHWFHHQPPPHHSVPLCTVCVWTMRGLRIQVRLLLRKPIFFSSGLARIVAGLVSSSLNSLQ